PPKPASARIGSIRTLYFLSRFSRQHVPSTATTVWRCSHWPAGPALSANDRHRTVLAPLGNVLVGDPGPHDLAGVCPAVEVGARGPAAAYGTCPVHRRGIEPRPGP